MKVPPARSWAVLLFAGAMAGAFAQSARDNDTPLPMPGQVLSDANPLPAEERDSTGAVVLDQSRVRAQQRAGFKASADRTGIPSAIGHNVARVMERARSWNDVREAEAPQAPRD